MHGGRRPKKCSLWVHGIDLSSLAVWCDRQHDHLPWGLAARGSKELFATGEERRYPFLFCQRLARMVGEQLAPELMVSVSGRAATEQQPRMGLNETVGEYKTTLLVPVEVNDARAKGDK
eukprot:2702487-Karenia_brevis.AAC.1